MKLADLTKAEQQAFFSLIRVIVRANSEFSAEEAAGLMDVAEELGSDEFQDMMNESAAWIIDEKTVKERARAVERKEIQEEIYGTLYTIATTDGTDAGENELLDWLAQTWDLDVSQVEPE
jgi:hypothetical protein